VTKKTCRDRRCTRSIWKENPRLVSARHTFRLAAGDQAHPFRITAHEEMWSLGDMLAAVPGLGTIYGQIFRRGFSYAFLGASYLSARWKGALPRPLGPAS